MILKSVCVQKFKSVADSGAVEFDGAVTCLVGKNESGKTAFLEALHRLNPLAMGHTDTFDGLRDYPRRSYSRDRESVPGSVPIEATLALELDDVKAVEGVFGEGVLAGAEVVIRKNYENECTWAIAIDERKLIEHLVANAGIDRTPTAGVASIQDLLEKLKAQEDPPDACSALGQVL